VLTSVPALMSAAEHDREAGRQLAWVLAVVSVLAVAGVIWQGLSEPLPAWEVAASLVPGALAVAAFLRPVIVIRAFSGRFTELLDDWAAGGGPRLKAIAEDIRPVLAASEEGASLDALAAERVIKTVPGRRRLGKLLMLGSLVSLGLVILLWSRLPEGAVMLPAGAFVSGLVIWYRTL
jgi:hypothetical protein